MSTIKMSKKRPGRKLGVGSFVEKTLTELAEIYGPTDKVRVSLIQLTKKLEDKHVEVKARATDTVASIVSDIMALEKEPESAAMNQVTDNVVKEDVDGGF